MLLGNAMRLIRTRPGSALLMRGGPGMGKTECAIHELDRDPNTVYVKFVAAQETPESVAGFLWIDAKDNTCHYLPNRRLNVLQKAMEEGKKAVCIVDEYKSGDRMVHNSLQQLIREHAVGDWIAKGHMYVIALTNRDEDRANTVRLSAPTIGRFIQVEVEPDFDYWSNWAGTEGTRDPNEKEKKRGGVYPRIHPDIIGWLRAIFIGGQSLKSDKAKEYAKQKDLLFCSPAPKDESAYPTPRSHEFASNVLFKHANDDDPFLLEVLSGTFGSGAGHEFLQWRKVGKQAAGIVNEVLAGKTIKKELDVGMQFFVNSQLASAYARSVKTTAGPITKYLSEMESEFAMVFINDIATISDKITKEKDWMKVVMKHKKVALAGKR